MTKKVKTKTKTKREILRITLNETEDSLLVSRIEFGKKFGDNLDNEAMIINQIIAELEAIKTLWVNKRICLDEEE